MLVRRAHDGRDRDSFIVTLVFDLPPRPLLPGLDWDSASATSFGFAFAAHSRHWNMASSCNNRMTYEDAASRLDTCPCLHTAAAVTALDFHSSSEAESTRKEYLRRQASSRTSVPASSGGPAQNTDVTGDVPGDVTAGDPVDPEDAEARCTGDPRL